MIIEEPGATISFIVDPDGLVNDQNRSNNLIHLDPRVVARRANLVMLAVQPLNGRVVASVRADGMTTDATVRLREVSAARALGQVRVRLIAGSTQQVAFDGIDLSDASHVYEACVESEDLVAEAIETDNCADGSSSSQPAVLSLPVENIRFAPWGANVGEKVELSATVENLGARTSSFAIEFTQGPPSWPGSVLIGRTGRLTAAPGGQAEGSLDWVRTEGPVEVYARAVGVDGRLEGSVPSASGRHLFLEEIFSFGFPPLLQGGVRSVRAGRVTGQSAPDLAVIYSLVTEAGVALVSPPSPAGRHVVWRRALGTTVEDLTLVDVDGDGSAELVVSHHGFDGVPWMTVLNADGSVRWAHSLAVSSSCNNLFAPAAAVGDLDSDGVADAAYYTGNSVVVLNAATGTTVLDGQLVAGLGHPCNADWSTMVIADTNGDGRNEVVASAGGAYFLMERDGSIRWSRAYSYQNLNSVFALADLDSDGEPELVFPLYKSHTIALSSMTGAIKYFGANTDNWPETLSVAPIRQNGLPFTVVSNNAFTQQVSALAPPGLTVTWSRVLPTANVALLEDLVLADLVGLGRPQTIGMGRNGGLVFLDSRDGRQLMARPLDLFPSETRYTGPIVAADLAGDGSSRVAVGFHRGPGATRPFWWPNGPINGDILIYGSAHWRQLPTAWPTRHLTKGRIGEDLKLSNDYRWWTTHNTFNTQFWATPSNPLADVEVSLSALSPVVATRVLSVPLSVTNVGGLAASNVEVALYDGKPSAGGRLVASSRVAGPLSPRTGVAPLSFSWVAYPEGLHTLCVTVNEDRAVEEPDFENNMACRVVRVGVETSGCDLAVLPGLLVGPAAAQPGDAVTLTATIQNVGSAACTATEASLDDGPPANRAHVSSALVGPLGIGESASVAFAFRAVMGARQWIVTADPGQTTLDIDRSNNVGTLDGLYSDATLPDLIVEAASAQPQPAYPGERVTVAVRVRNLGAPSPESALSVGVAQGAVPALASGAAADVQVMLTAAAMSSVLQVTVDPEASIGELDEGNNTLALALRVSPSSLELQVVAAPNPVAPQTPVAITLQLTPRDGVAHAVTLEASLVDALGQAVALISALPRVVSQLGETAALPWSSGSTAPGQYIVKVDALENGRLIGSGTAPLQVVPGTPALTAALTANRGSVPAGGDVVLSFAARNDSGNLTLGPLVGTLSVLNQAGQLIFREVRQLGTLLTGGFRTGASVVSIGRGALPGRYSATLDVANATTLLAQAGAAFDVTANPGTLVGTLSAAAHFQVGGPLPVEVLLENGGALAVTGETLTVELLDAEGGLAAQSVGAIVVTIAAGASSSHTFALATTGVPTGQKLLVARLGGRVLDTRPLTAVPLSDVEPPRIDVAGISDGDFTNQDVRPVVSVTDASAFSSVVMLDGAPFLVGSAIIAEGPHVLTVDAQDAFANRALLAVHFVIDKTPPVLALTGPLDGSLQVAAQLLTWTARDASPVTTLGTLDGVAISSGAQVAVEGDFVWAVRAEDAAGNVTSELRRFAIDASAPTVVVVAPEEGTYVRGPVLLEWTVNDTHPGVVTALLDGSPVTSPATVVAEGLHALLVTATDALGNTSTSSRSFTIDDTPPSLSISGVVDGAVTRGPVVPVVSATDASPLTLSLSLDGAPFASGSSVTTQGLHTLLARAADAAGNETVRTVSFTIDDVPPVITVTGVLDGALLNTQVNLSFAASDPNLVTVFAMLDGVPFTSEQPVSLEGAHVLVVTAVDAAGNAGVRTVSFTLDFTPPSINVSGVTDGASGASFTPVVTVGSATVVTITLDGSAFASGTTVTAPGAHLLAVVAADGAGNRTTVTVHFTIVAGSGGCVDLSLVARREYSPSRWFDAARTFSRPVRVTIPWTLDVTSGNAGKQNALLFFALSGRTTRCEYEGGSPAAHPQRPSDVLAGRTYRLRGCTGGYRAGSTMTTGELRLHVHQGDSRRGTTEVTWRMEELAPCVGATSTDVSAPGHCGHNSAACNQDDGEDDDDCDEDDDDGRGGHKGDGGHNGHDDDDDDDDEGGHGGHGGGRR